MNQAVSWSVTKIGTALNSPPGMDRTIRGQIFYPKGNHYPESHQASEAC